MTDLPAVATSNTNMANFHGEHREAAWAVKRLLLKQQLVKQVRENERRSIDTSVMVYDITDQKWVYKYNTDYVHYAASVSKMFVTAVLLDELRAGSTTLDTVVSWDASDRRAGAGVYDSDTSPLSATVREVLFDMLNQSGNTAVRAIVNKVLGGAAAVNAKYEQNYPTLEVTRLQPLSSTSFLLGYTTPAESDLILAHLYSQTDDYAAFVKNALATNIFDDYGPRSQVQDHENITVIDKQGQLNDPEGNNRHDIGIIENAKNGHKLRYVLMTTNYEQPAGEATDYAVSSLQEFGRDMLRFEGDKKPRKSNQQQSALRSQSDIQVQNGRMTY
jgi:beta-lactamase class A